MTWMDWRAATPELRTNPRVLLGVGQAFRASAEPMVQSSESMMCVYTPEEEVRIALRGDED
jgi:hypothetical protein